MNIVHDSVRYETCCRECGLVLIGPPEYDIDFPGYETVIHICSKNLIKAFVYSNEEKYHIY